MFRKMKENPYFKAGVTVLISGAILILFFDWVDNTHFSVGFETLKSAMTPIVIGCVLAFILCPVYNACVRYLYNARYPRAGEVLSQEHAQHGRVGGIFRLLRREIYPHAGAGQSHPQLSGIISRSFDGDVGNAYVRVIFVRHGIACGRNV